MLAISDGLQVVSWVTLWFPVNLLVYDRWYYRREHKVYRLIERDGDQPGAVRSSPERARWSKYRTVSPRKKNGASTIWVSA